MSSPLTILLILLLLIPKGEEMYLASLIRNDLFVCEITLVSNKKLVNILTGISVYFIQPLLHIVKALLICHIIYHLYNQINTSKISSFVLKINYKHKNKWKCNDNTSDRRILQ